MAKRKVKFDFTPSEYQQKFFDFVEHGIGNAVIDAKAGSGKTSTCVAAMKLIPKTEKCLFIAFNKSIADELNEKLKSKTNVTARTTHSLGFLMLRRNLGSDIEVDEYKYRNYIKSNISTLTSTSCDELRTKTEVNDYIDRITSLIDFSRFNLVQTEKEMNKIAERYNIPVSYDECSVALKCMEWGKKNVETIDYADMIWLPVELHLKPMGMTYDWVYFDECQDASLMSIQLFLKCIKQGGRFVCVGDPSQSINQFAGSSEEAFNFLKNYKNTTLFELPISYRCAKSIVKFANNIVPDMKPRENAPEGIIEDVSHVKDIKDGDMVLARSKSPLVKLYIKLLRNNINCYIKGQDIGNNLVTILEKINKDKLCPKLDQDGVFVRLFDELFKERNDLMRKRGLDYNDATTSSYIMDKYDMINTLLILSEKFTKKTDLIKHIRNIFKENSSGICLSTVHKAKGLESENVYILCHSSMPSKLATLDWEKKQEENLMYVAYTRAKNKLGFISEREIKPSGSLLDPMEIINELSFIEKKVCDILGKKPMEHLENAELARFKLQNKTEIKDIEEIENVVKVKDMKVDKKKDNLIEELETLLK